MNPVLDHVEAIATDVRNWAEGRAGNRNRELSEWCAIASAELHSRLLKEGIDCEIHMASDVWGSHCYLMIEDHVVDITATQFGVHERIYIKHHREAEENYFHITDKVYADAAQLRADQIKWGWPKHQIAFAKSVSKKR